MSKRIWPWVLAAALLLGGCRAAPAKGGAFRFSLPAEPLTLDPQTAADEAALTVIESLFEGPVALSAQGEVVPAAADWVCSADGLTYTFTLTDSLWSDGVPVTADDFVFAAERTADPATRSPHRAVFDKVAAVSAVNDSSFTVTLKSPDAGFLAAVAAGAWYPCRRDFFAACAGSYGMEADTLLQNGPFTLAAWTHGTLVSLRRHTGYHGAADIAPAVVRFFMDGRQTDLRQLAEGEAIPDGTQVTAVDDTLSFLWFNTAASPLGSAAVRRALRDAVEWETVTPLLGAPTASYVSPAARVGGQPYRSALPAHAAAPDRAAFSAALAAQGLTACPALTLLCAEGEETRRLAQYIVQSWQKNLSVYFSIEQVPADTLATRTAAGNFTLAIASVTAPGNSPADALSLFAGEAGRGNLARYANAAWAASVTAAADETALQSAEAALADACPAVPLAVVTRRFALADDISGMTVRPFCARPDFRHALREG